MDQRRRLNRSLWGGAVGVTVAVTASVLLTPHLIGSAAPELQPVSAYSVGTKNVADGYARTSSAGLGRADLGGLWSANPAKGFGVVDGAARVRPLAAGHGARAVLAGLGAADEQLRTTFALDALPTGRGVYLALETRRQADGDTYRTRVFIAPTGELRLDVVQVSGRRERIVSDSVILNWRLKARQRLTLETFVTGTAATATNLKVRAWATGKTIPSWQITTVQTDRDRITHAGAVGLWFYSSIHNPAPAVTVDDTSGWQLRPHPVTSKPTGTAPGSPGTPGSPGKPTGTHSTSPTTSPSKSPSKPPATSPTRSPTTSPSKSPSKPPATSPSKSPSTSVPPPTKPGVPGPSNTGVPAGTKLTVVKGDLKITKAGATYSGLDVRGFVRVEAPNVTIKNSIIRGGRAKGNIGLVNAGTGSSGFRISDSELVPQNPSVWIDGLKGWNYSASRLNIHGTVDGAKVYGNGVSIKDSWIHGTEEFASDPNQHGGPTHNDGVQILSGKNTTIEHNTIEGGSNSALQVTQGHGAVSGLYFARNEVGGGACSVNITSHPMSTIGSVTLSSNRFLRTSEYACPMIIDSQVRYSASDNRYLDNGQPVGVVRR